MCRHLFVDTLRDTSEDSSAPPQGPPVFTREKDRVMYDHQHFKIDLTQVTPSNQSEKVGYFLFLVGTRAPHSVFEFNVLPSQIHELEVEFAHPQELRRLMELRGNGGPEQYGYDQLVAVFVNNCRILAKNAH